MSNKKISIFKTLSWKKLFLIFLIFSIFGSLFEQVQYVIRHYQHTKEIQIPSRTAVIYGQVNMIYGFGAVLFVLLLSKLKKWYQIFIFGSLIGGIFEYLVSFLQEFFVGTSSWDYSQKFLNINGRTTIPIMCIWGLLSLLLIKIAYPYLSSLIEKIPASFGNILVSILLILITLDALISWTALIRQNHRRKGYPPMTKIGAICDKIYPDEVLKKAYPNMNYKKRCE